MLQEERQRDVSLTNTQTSEPAVLAANFGSNQNSDRDTRGRQHSFKRNDKGGNFGWVGHMIDIYYVLHGYPPGHRLPKENTELLIKLQHKRGSQTCLLLPPSLMNKDANCWLYQ